MPHFYSDNRPIQGFNDNILDPLLGKPLSGREKEIAALADLLAQEDVDVQVAHHLVLAEGGVGKTELCKAALRVYLRLHPFKKAWFVNLENASQIPDLWQRMATAIGLDNLRSDAELLAALPEGIYYLDNLESLAEAPGIAAALRSISLKPGVRLLASSRVEIPGWGKTFDLTTLPLPAAVALFRQIWDETGAQPIPEGPDALADFVKQELGCLPLAIVLVAALGRYEHTFEAVQTRWQEEGAAAGHRPGAAPDSRLDSLEHSIRLSLRHLSPEARLLWGLAAFFPAGLPNDFFETLRQAEPQCREARDLLIRHQILHRQPDGRLRLSPPLARFARDRAARDAEGFEATPIFSRLTPWLKALGDAANSDRSGQQIDWLFEEISIMQTILLFFNARLKTQPTGFFPMLWPWKNFYTRRIFLGISEGILDAMLARIQDLRENNRA